LGTIPIGGYVKISGMSPAENLPDDVRDRAYHAQPVWKRMVVIAAGPAMNFVLALLLIILFFTAFGPRDLGVAAIQKGFPAPGTRSRSERRSPSRSAPSGGSPGRSCSCPCTC